MHAHHLRRPGALIGLAIALLAAGCSAGDGSGVDPTATSTSVPAGPPTTVAPTTITSTTGPTTMTRPATTAPAPPSTAAPPAGGPLRTGRATHYRLTGMGNCMFPDYPGRDARFVALNATDYGTADLCGATLSVQGNRGSVTVKVIDQCPECPPGALDLSPEAFALVTGDAGVTTVQWRVVSGPAQPPISYRIKEGSSAWWVGILVMDHRNPIRTLEARVGGRWVPLQRQEYNYFLAPNGLGAGPFDVRVTDTFGEQLVSSGLTPEPGRVIRTSQQLTGR